MGTTTAKNPGWQVEREVASLLPRRRWLEHDSAARHSTCDTSMIRKVAEGLEQTCALLDQRVQRKAPERCSVDRCARPAG